MSANRRKWKFSWGISLLALAGLCLGSTELRAQVTPEQAAAMILASARKAYNEKSYPFAVTRFREYLAKYGGNKEAPSARYGLALALLAGPQKNYTEIRELLQPLAGNKSLPEHPHILYNLGLAIRGLGLQEIAVAQAKPQEANQRRDAAKQRFEESRQQFALALAAFSAKAKDDPADLEWAARARCDQAEMQLRVNKIKEAKADTAGFLNDPVLIKSKYRDLGRYYHGFASFLLHDYATAEKTLSMLAPFSDPAFGTHARYLLARTHHQAEERAEAKLHFEGALNDYAKNKKSAEELLRNPAKFKNDPAERERLEALIRSPVPDHVVRATFYLGVLLYEGGNFAEAQARFAAFPKLYPTSPLKTEAELRLGFCQVQSREFAEAIKTLAPLVDRDRLLADQALFWIGKAQVGMAPDAQTNWPGHQKALLGAQGAFIQAANRAEQIAAMDPEAKGRRGQILLELADTQHHLKQPKEAAASYNQILNDKLLPQRNEEIHQRLITALHLSGDYTESDKMCTQFLERYPQSTLLPAVLFRQAENSYFRMLAAQKSNPKDQAKFQDEAIRRYSAIVEKYPEAPQVNLARHSLGLTLYRKGDLEEARKTWSAIPQADQNGDLAVVPYLMADCVLRLAPRTVPEDALEAGKLEEQLKKAADLLEAFIGGQPKSPETPDALLKLGLCQQRLATIFGQPAEKTKALTSARAAYERITGQFGQHKLMPQAVLERAKCMAQMNDSNGAINELRRFTNDPLQKANIAPMALLELATLLRGQNKAAEGATILAKAREKHEAGLGKDPERAGWVALLRYHHGLCLKEAGKLPEARTAFDLVMKQSAGKPEAVESALRFGQCLAEEGQRKVESAKKKLAGTKKTEEIAAANKLQEDGYKSVADALQFLDGQAEQLKKQQPTGDVRARMLYETAWGYRFLGERELARAREAKIQELIKKRPKEAALLPPPEVPIKDIPLQASEKKARGHYRALIDSFPDLPLSTEARFELAELLSERHQYTEALKLLAEGLDKEPPPELTDKIRIRMGVVQFAKGDKKAAFAQFNAVAQNPKSPLAGQGHYRAGECLMHDKEWAEAVKRFLPFRDQPQFQNIPGVSDRALLRLGQAYAHLGNWEASRQAHERLAGAFGNSPWVDEARYGIGWAWQQQKQYDQAVNAYNQVIARTATETAAKAQLQIGLCRLEQKRYQEAANALLVVPFTYDYPELSAAAFLEAARAFTALKENTQAIRLLERLIRDHPQSALVDAARERLAEIRKIKQGKQ